MQRMDEFETVNGAWRSTDGRFWMLPERIFYADGRRSVTPDKQHDLSRRIAMQAGIAGNPTPMIAMPAVRSLRRMVDELEYEVVARARAFYWSWRAIGDAMGVSAAAAHRRYARVEVKPRRRRDPAP